MDLVSDLEWLYRQDLTKNSLGSTAVLRINEEQQRLSLKDPANGHQPTEMLRLRRSRLSRVQVQKRR